jgi:Cysteine sulfinate desulfinase/cysteine desulfurase and related enzymes
MPYFDHNSTTPLADCAREAWLRVQAENWHNPSSPTRAGARARIRLDSYHEALSILLGGAPEEYVFNSGATEGAHAVLAHWAAKLGPTARIAVAATEHAAVLAAAGRFFGGRIDRLAHDVAGNVSVDTVRAAIESGAAGVVVMAANNETGVIQPWPEIAAACRAANGGSGVPYLCDATQWLGKLPGAGLGDCGAWVIASGHKFGAPKGVGFVKLPSGKNEPDFVALGGGLQERGHRAGTEDVAGASALCAALGECERVHVIWEWQREEWRKAFERELVAALPGVRIVGADTSAGGAAPADRLWNTVFAVMPHGEATRWIARLDKRDIQVSSGAACTTNKDGPSHVLAALGYAPEEARRALRFSAGWSTTEADWAALLAALREIAPGLVAG